MNNAVSAGASFIPVVGDVILAMYKANSRNAALLEEYLRIRGEEFLKVQEQERVMQGLQLGNIEETRRTKGVSKKDAKQAKPGAGIGKGEIVPTEPTTYPATEEDKTPGKAFGSGRKVLGLFRGGKSGVGLDRKAPSSGDKGRFVEHVEPTSTSDSSPA